MRRLPVRVRVTAAFAAVMALVLAAAGVFVYLGLRSALTDSVDESLESRASAVAALLRESGTDRGLPEGFDERGETFTQVVATGERVVLRSPALADRPLVDEQGRAEASSPSTVTVSGPGLEEPDEDTDPEEAREQHEARVLSQSVDTGGRQFDVLVGARLEDRDETLAQLFTVLAIGLPAALLLAAAAGYVALGGALRPVERMRQRAAQVSAAEPGRRLPVPAADDELSRLAVTLNEMLARLERALERERALAADAGHELRTPLAIMKAELELALQSERSVPELRAAIASAGEEVDRLTAIAEDLLLLAASDKGKLPLRLAQLDAADVLERVRDRFAARAAEAARELRVEASPGLSVEADELRLEQALGNLVENALRHGGGDVVLSAREGDGGSAVGLSVRDHGDGFPDEFLPRAFERFSRADSARSGPGAGLGLSIVAVIAGAHGGSADVTNGDAGAEVTIRLPAQRAALTVPSPSRT